MNPEKPFNPLDKLSLGISVSEALLERPVLPLPPVNSFLGAGIYAIYYIGDFEPYRRISEANREERYAMPIYVGKAVPTGARKGGIELETATGTAVYKRLREHAESVQQAKNLNLEDFRCRYLIVDDIWIPLGEAMMITRFAPIWNRVIDGYGNHNPGSGRHQGKRPPWDVIHPGRPWADLCADSEKTKDQILSSLSIYLDANMPKV